MSTQRWLWLNLNLPLIEELKDELLYEGFEKTHSDYICIKREVGLSELIQVLIK